MDGDVELIKEILPNVDDTTIRKVLRETGDLGAAVKQLLFPGSPVIRRAGAEKRTVITIHSSCSEIALDAVKTAVVSVRSADVIVRDSGAVSSISVSFQKVLCHPLIYIEPSGLDYQFFDGIQPASIVLTSHFDDIDLKVSASFNTIILLPLTPETISQAVHQVLIENHVIGSGSPLKKYGELWQEMLCLIPGIRSTYAEVVANTIPNPYSVVHRCPTHLVSRGGNKVPDKILERLKLFYSTDDPSVKLETPNQKRRSPDDM
jgi:hypothetical protein